MKNDDIVLNMIMNPETPYEAVESISDKAKNSKVDFISFEAKFDQDKLKMYKVRLKLIFTEIFSILSQFCGKESHASKMISLRKPQFHYRKPTLTDQPYIRRRNRRSC